MTHTIKIEDSFADAVLCGDKNFEVRWNDRGYQKGDIVQFIPLENNGIVENKIHPLVNKQYEITYVLSGHGIEEGYIVFGIREVKQSGQESPNR